MALTYDHIVIAVNDLAKATDDFTRAGFTVTPGGVHKSGKTHNALITFEDGSYFELIAFRNPEEASEPHHWWDKLKKTEGTVDFALLSGDVARDADRLKSAGLKVDGPNPNGRLRPDGQKLEWRTISLRNTGSPLPFLIDDQTPRELRVPPAPATYHALGVSGVAGVVLLTTDLEHAADTYRALLGTEPVKVAPSVPGADAAVRFNRDGQWLELVQPAATQRNLLTLAEDRGAAPWQIVLRGQRTKGDLPLEQTHQARISIAA